VPGSVFQTAPGQHLPAGAHVRDGGVNFSVFSRGASRMWLQLYASPQDAEPMQVIELDVHTHRTFFFWHVFVEGAQPGIAYTWRAAGPADTSASGYLFDERRELLDPWAMAVDPVRWDRARASEDPLSPGIRARVLPADGYDWEGDEPLHIPLADTVIYELHVGGFTRDPSAGVSAPGTFLGLVEKIPYLVDLGVTHVELLPVMAYDEQDVPVGATDLGLSNYWGYSTYGFFAPHPGYVIGDNPRDEFRDMVKALHRAGIGVILDVVFNHTAEGGTGGPVINFKGLGNDFFYHLDPDDRSLYRDYTGCGNTVNCNHPLVARFILECLEYWVREMHVDGFRLDLASVLARGEDGEPMYHAPVLWSTEFSTTLAHTHLIAEAWDAAGLYQVVDFPGYRWAEWNGDYRDTMRAFLRGDDNLIARVASRLAGSSDLYAAAGRLPVNSINFLTCHDGFTLNDLVSYNHKHNEANGEDNRDGHNHNLSWNCGAEGPTTDSRINALRLRQAKNALAILMLSQGVPMLLSGDEVLRSQQGNNNAYCQDNPLGWFDWSLVRRNAGMLRFVRELVRLRKRRPSLRRHRFLTGVSSGGETPDIAWSGARLAPPDWHLPGADLLAVTLAGQAPGEPVLHLVMNMGEQSQTVRLPQGVWNVVIDTSRPSPEDIGPPAPGRLIRGRRISVRSRSVVALEMAAEPT
jgi:glycogen operon protein